MIRSLDNFLEKFAKWAVVICIFLMLTLSVASIALRWFEISFVWIGPLVRHLVFIAAFLGGSLATGANQHIKIDLLSRILEKSEKPLIKKGIETLVLIVTFVACFILVRASYDFTLSEFEYGSEQFLGIHSGYLVAIIPAGMALISLRVITQLLLRLRLKE